MLLLRWLQRMKQSRGHGIHSPFAYNLITRVLRSPYSCYAFQDIATVLTESGLDASTITEFNHLSYRLVHYFNAKIILEFNSGNGVNTLFLTAPAPDIRCTCVEKAPAAIAIARRLQQRQGKKWEVIPVLPVMPEDEKKRYDALFIHLKETNPITIETLIALSHENSFWVFYPLNSSWSKQYWRHIVKDERVRITFDTKDTGIVFFRFTYNKLHYSV